MASHFDFANLVATRRDLVLTRIDDHVGRLQPRKSDLVWRCDLDDGTSNDETHDPASFVRWVCPALRVRSSTTGTAVPPFNVRRDGPQSDLGRLLKGLGRLARRTASNPLKDDVQGKFAYTDPTGLLDVGLRGQIENWPAAHHGDGVVRPAELWQIKVTNEGLVVESVSWWGSAPALDHQIGLALEIAYRLTTPR